MPKSSRTSRTPISFSASSEAIALADSSTRTLSVISRRRWTGSRPVRATISATVAGRSRWATWRAERLTATSKGRASGRCSCQARIWRQARSCTQRPIGSIRPLSSAIETNSAGSSRPRSGCCQRTSASSPLISPERRLTTGW